MSIVTYSTIAGNLPWWQQGLQTIWARDTVASRMVCHAVGNGPSILFVKAGGETARIVAPAAWYADAEDGRIKRFLEHFPKFLIWDLFSDTETSGRGLLELPENKVRPSILNGWRSDLGFTEDGRYYGNFP